MKLKLIEPFRELFKDEVRALGRELDVPDEILMRHPFPGPGLAVRIDAEEVLTEAFLEARRKWAQFQGRSGLTPYAWLYGIVHDCLIEAWRRQTRGWC